MNQSEKTVIPTSSRSQQPAPPGGACSPSAHSLLPGSSAPLAPPRCLSGAASLASPLVALAGRGCARARAPTVAAACCPHAPASWSPPRRHRSRAAPFASSPEPSCPPPLSCLKSVLRVADFACRPPPA
ncbi:hypothetical protein VPH35_109759 [Triticum aestivum]